MESSERRSTAGNFPARRRTTFQSFIGRRSTRFQWGSRFESENPITRFLASPFALLNTPKVVRAFNSFDQAGRKQVNIKDIPTIVRVLGLYPSDAEVAEIIGLTEDPDFQNYVRFDTFLPIILQMMEEKKYPPASPEVLLQAFEYFDPEKKGYLEEDFFNQIMTVAPEDEEGIEGIEKLLEDIRKSREIKVSISDEKIPETPPPEEEVVEEKPKKKMYEEEEKPVEVVDTSNVEPLSSEELSELLQVALDKETNTIFYGDLILKFLSCQHFKESEV